MKTVTYDETKFKLVPVDKFNRLTDYLGTAHCGGYKCRLPHCSSCNDEKEAAVAEQEMWNLLHEVSNAAAPVAERPPAPTGEVTVTTDEAGNCVAVTRNDPEGRILSVIWQHTAPPAQQQQPQTEQCRTCGGTKKVHEGRCITLERGQRHVAVSVLKAAAQAVATEETGDDRPAAPIYPAPAAPMTTTDEMAVAKLDAAIHERERTR